MPYLRRMSKNAVRPAVQLPVGGEVPEFTIHDRLAKARAYYAKQIGYALTQDEFAEMVGCSGATVSNYELGNVSRLNEAVLREWSRVTGVNYRWLKTGESENRTGPGSGGEWAPSGSNRRPKDYGSPILHLLAA